MKKTSRILAIVLTICMSITAMATLAACPDKGFELESFTVDMSTIKTTYKVGEQVDFSGIKVNIRFTDEKYNKQLGFADLLITYPTDITSTVGVKEVTVQYTDVTGTKRYTSFNITVEAAEPVIEKGSVALFTLPASIVDYNDKVDKAKKSKYGSNTFESEYIDDEDNVYYVGSANEFKFAPVLKVFDEQERPQVVSKYRTTTKVYMDGEKTPLISALTDEDNIINVHSFDETEYVRSYDADNKMSFGAAAIGHTFRIVVTFDREFFEVEEDSVGSVNEQVELTVKVIDAYNVYSAAELVVIDNVGVGDRGNNDNTTEAYAAFKESHGLSNVNAKGVVLHNDLTLTCNDIPSCYYERLAKPYEYKDQSGNVMMTANAFMKDESNIYARRILKDETFSLIGNFFTVDCSQLPLAPSPAAANDVKAAEYGGIQISDYGSNYSNVSLIRILGGGEASGDTALSGNAIVKNVMFIGNANRNEVTDSKGSLVSAGGLICIKSQGSNLDYNNTIQNKFFISIFPNYSGVTNANKVKVFDSYQNAVFIYGGGVLNINSSYMLRSGGPLCIIQHLNPQSNTQSDYPVVNASDSYLESYCDGNEMWFASVGATEIAGQLKLINNFFLQAQTSKVMLDKNGKMNIICVNMSDGSNAGETVKNVYTQGKFSISKNGKTATLNRLLSQPFYKELVMPKLVAGAVVINAVDDADQKSFVYFDGQSKAYSGASGAIFAPSADNLVDYAIWNTFNEANHFAINMGGFGIMLGLVEASAASAE